MDGNFSADHLKMRNPDDDVSITDGSGFMVGDERYKAHLRIAKDHKEVGTRFMPETSYLDLHRRNRLAMTTERSIRPMPIRGIVKPPESVPRLVPDMAASFLTQLSTFKKEKGRLGSPQH